MLSASMLYLMFGTKMSLFLTTLKEEEEGLVSNFRGHIIYRELLVVHNSSLARWPEWIMAGDAGSASCVNK